VVEVFCDGDEADDGLIGKTKLLLDKIFMRGAWFSL
jgi:hypothetical protein